MSNQSSRREGLREKPSLQRCRAERRVKHPLAGLGTLRSTLRVTVLGIVLAACGGTAAPSATPASPATSTAASPAASKPAGSAAPVASGAAGGAITVGLAGDIESGDPFLNSSIHGKSVALYMFDNLIE